MIFITLHFVNENLIITLFMDEKSTPQFSMCHIVALQFTLKKYLKGKRRRIMETQIFHHAKI
jgi:hypothetical protein